ncbi:hypothetical protein BHE74_00054133, partial [Ensete ventricosum]
MKERTYLIMHQYRSILILLELVRELGYSTSPIPLVVEKTMLLGFARLLELRESGTVYCLLRSLVEHSCINPKSPAFGYLDEKSIDTGLMKFLGLYPSALSWYLEFAFVFSTSSPLLRPMISLNESKGSM